MKSYRTRFVRAWHSTAVEYEHSSFSETFDRSLHHFTKSLFLAVVPHKHTKSRHLVIAQWVFVFFLAFLQQGKQVWICDFEISLPSSWNYLPLRWFVVCFVCFVVVFFFFFFWGGCFFLVTFWCVPVCVCVFEGLRELFQDHTFVGCVSEELALMQHQTQLYLVNTHRLR